MPHIMDMELTIKEVKELIKNQDKKKPALFLWGKPGIGKTSGVNQATNEMGIGYIKFDASMKDPTDIRGVLFVIDGKARYLEPDELPNLARDGKVGVLFLDEILFAVPAVQNNLHSLVLERKIGNYKFPEDWTIIAASNRQEDRVQIYELSGPLSNRFCHINVKEDYDEWSIGWAIQNDIDPLIISYLKLHPDHFCQKPDSLNVFATPRSWQFANEYLKDEKIKERLKRAAIAGCVGAGIEEDLNRHKEIGSEALKMVESIKSGKMPNISSANISLLYVVNIYFATNIKGKNNLLPNVCDYIKHLGGKSNELAIHMVKLGIGSNRAIIKEKGWYDVAQKYNKFLED